MQKGLDGVRKGDLLKIGLSQGISDSALTYRFSGTMFPRFVASRIVVLIAPVPIGVADSMIRL